MAELGAAGAVRAVRAAAVVVKLVTAILEVAVVDVAVPPRLGLDRGATTAELGG